MLDVRVGSMWLSDIGAFGDLTYSETWDHRCEQARWGMRAGTRHPALRAGAPVQVYQGPFPCWSGMLGQPERDGTFTADGKWKWGTGVLARDGSGNLTTDPDAAVRRAVNSGAVPWKFNGMDATPLGDVDATLTLTALLDRYTESSGRRWGVDHTGELVTSPVQTTPSYAITSNDDLWSVAADEYLTHLDVTYLSSSLTFSTFTWTTPDSLAAAAAFGPRYDSIDLTDRGIITAGAAQSIATTIITSLGPQMVLSEPFRVVPGQLRTLGDVARGWGDVHAGQTLRVWGLPDRSRAALTGHTDVPIGKVERTASTLTLTPQGAPPRNVRDVIATITANAA